MKKHTIVSGLVGASLLLGAALPVLAQERQDMRRNASSTPRAEKVVNVACIQSAVSKRDLAVASALDAHVAGQKTAIVTRTSAINAGWAVPAAKDRRAALRTAWKNFESSSMRARKAFRDSNKTVWKQFDADMKACGAPSGDEPGAKASADTQL